MISRIVESFQQAEWENNGRETAMLTKRAGDWTGTVLGSSEGGYRFYLTLGEVDRGHASYELLDQGSAPTLTKAIDRLDYAMEWHSNERSRG